MRLATRANAGAAGNRALQKAQRSKIPRRASRSKNSTKTATANFRERKSGHKGRRDAVLAVRIEPVEVAENQAVMLVSHQLNLVARFADTMILLHEGHIAAAGVPEEVMQASILERVYDWPVVVSRDPAVGTPALVPLRVRSRTPRSSSSGAQSSTSGTATFAGRPTNASTR